MNKDGSNDRRLTIRGENDETPSWSPKGDVIAFSALDNDKEFDIFTVDTSGQNYQRLTYDSKNNEYPSWSPDGKFITFSSNRDGKYQIWIMNKDGSNQRRLTNGDYEYFSPDWSSNVK
jgi:TolB protein